MENKINQELLEINNEISELNNDKSELESQAEIKRQELKVINDEIAEIQGLLIQKERIKSDLEIVEKWLLEKEGKQ